jgi:hypothetical protein
MSALFSAVPLTWRVVAGLAVLAAIAGGYLFWHHRVYQSGYDDAIQDVANHNAVAARTVRDAVSKPRACRDGGGRWDVTRGVCD